MLFGEFLNTLAGKAGINLEDADLKKVLSSPTLSAAEIPDAITAKISTSLMTADAAKNNPEVIKSIKAQLYNGVDSELNKAYEDLGLDDATKQELLLEKNTNARITKSLKKIADLEKAKAGKGTGEKAALDAEITRLNGEIKKANDDKTAAIKSMQAEHENALLTYDLKNQLAQMNYAFPKEMPKNLQVETALLTINNDLKNKDGKLIRENGALKLIRLSTGGAYFNEKNEAVDAKGFIDASLAQNKLLAVTNPNPNPNPNPTPVPDPNPQKINSRTFDQQVEASLADLTKGTTEPVPA